jgi:hypothetical protein
MLMAILALPISAAGIGDTQDQPVKTEREAMEIVTVPFMERPGTEEEDVSKPSDATEESLAAESQQGTDANRQSRAGTTLDECDWELEGQEIQEKSREVLRSWSCHSFRWFDSWFGDSYDFDEKGVSGLLTFGADYRQYDGFDPRLRLRVRSSLPNMSSRWDLLLGRVDEGAYVSDSQTQDRTFYNPGLIERRDEESWLLGLGHRRNGHKSGWDYSLGVRLRIPPRPYAKLQYYYNKSFSEKTDLRFRQTIFWRSDHGFGTTSRGDVSHSLKLKDVLRWEGLATISEVTKGTSWYFGQTWYHLFGNRSTFSLLSFLRGETSAPVELKEYGFNLIWRRPLTRDWIYLSLGPSLTWPREHLQEKREASLGFGAWIEVGFGNLRY